ncbi:MAG TPA: hypothetical protein VFB72_10875 [Verrucomicrobiae bacterium]|nr:hypothetical protein [Verrucomicrobiae bacterium]
MMSDETIDALRKAADLKPKDPKLSALIAFSLCIKWFSETRQTNIDLMPEKTRQCVHLCMDRLEKLSQEPDKETAAEALHNLAMLIFVSGGPRDKALDCARRAVSLDPKLEMAWEMVLGFSEKTSPDELSRLCESRLRTKESARNHLLLAKSLTNLSKWDRVEAEANAALKSEPDNIIAEMVLAALKIRLSTDDESLAQAYPLLTKATELYQKLPDGDPEALKRWRELTLNDIICNGLLSDEQSQKEARKSINDFISQYPDDEDARKIREALE